MRKRWSAAGMTAPNSLMNRCSRGRRPIWRSARTAGKHGARGVDVAKRHMRAGEQHDASGVRAGSRRKGANNLCCRGLFPVERRVRCCGAAPSCPASPDSVCARGRCPRWARRRRPPSRSPRQGCGDQADVSGRLSRTARASSMRPPEIASRPLCRISSGPSWASKRGNVAVANRCKCLFAGQGRWWHRLRDSRCRFAAHALGGRARRNSRDRRRVTVEARVTAAGGVRAPDRPNCARMPAR